MEKQDERNNIMEEKTRSVLSHSAGIEKVASETTETTPLEIEMIHTPSDLPRTSYLYGSLEERETILRLVSEFCCQYGFFEVCGLKWSCDDRELASGGNDNQHSETPRLTEHTAAVKAIAWSPHQSNLLVSGGGTADRCIRFWNTTNGHQLNSVDTGSQVCNLAWSKNVNELVSTHGYSQNQIMVWKYPSLSKLFDAPPIDRNQMMKNINDALSWIKAYREDSLPLSRNDLKNVLLADKALNRKHFLPFVVESVRNISPQQRGILLTSCGGLLSYLARNSTAPFEFQFGKTTNTPVPSLLSFEDAVLAFFPEMAHIATFMIFYILTWVLVLPLQFGVLIYLVLILISAPFFYFPELIRKATTSGIHVACGSSFKPSLIGFTTLGAFGITLIFGLVAFLVFYFIWRFVYGRRPTRGKDIEVSLDDFMCLTTI